MDWFFGEEEEGFPRTRGDRPPDGSWATIELGVPPHTRG